MRLEAPNLHDYNFRWVSWFINTCSDPASDLFSWAWVTMGGTLHSSIYKISIVWSRSPKSSLNFTFWFSPWIHQLLSLTSHELKGCSWDAYICPLIIGFSTKTHFGFLGIPSRKVGFYSTIFYQYLFWHFYEHDWSIYLQVEATMIDSHLPLIYNGIYK